MDENQTGSDLVVAQKSELAPVTSAALQAREVATIQAMTSLAFQRPRDLDVVRAKLLRDCERPSFADAAIYLKPIGKGIEGPSIRFAESLRRHMGNIRVRSSVVEETESYRKVWVGAFDLEANVSEELESIVEKTVERSRIDPSREVIATRRNSRGEPAYVVRATEDEMLGKTNAVMSKLRRNAIIALAPADVVEDAIRKCNEVCAKRDAKDPQATKKGMIDTFGSVGVTPVELREYLDVPDLDKPFTEAQLKELRKILTALRDGETTWAEVMRAKHPPKTDEKGKPAAKEGTKTERLEQELGAKPPPVKEPGGEG